MICFKIKTIHMKRDMKLAQIFLMVNIQKYLTVTDQNQVFQ